jgi:hypothetical protein
LTPTNEKKDSNLNKPVGRISSRNFFMKTNSEMKDVFSATGILSSNASKEII